MTTANFETEKVDEKEYGVVASVAELEQQAPTQQQETIRALKGRQMSMIAIGGAIGTGLIIGSGTSLARSGPGSLFIAYITMGTACLGVMCALGEMSTRYPTKKGFAGHASRCVDEAFGFATAVVYLCKYLIASPAQIVAFSLVIRFWNADINGAAWVTCAIVFVVIINMLGIEWFGELEFWFSFIKIIAFAGLILLTLIIDLGGIPGQPRLGFTYWQNGKAFKAYKLEGDVGKFLGFVNALVLALFAYMGCEIVGVTVGEAKNPRKAVPAAIKKTFFRIAFFYIFGVFVLGMAVDSSSPDLVAAAAAGTAAGAAASPFVVAIKAANIKIVPAIANAALIVFTMSSANSDQYISSRTLYGMALDGHAPKFFTRCTKRGVPWAAFMVTAPFMLLAYLVSNTGALKIFNYLTSAITLLGGIAWICILSSHIAMMRAMKAQGISRDTLPWTAPFQPYFSYVALCFTCVVCFFKGFDSFMPFDLAAFITHYIGFAIFGVSYVGYRIIKKVKPRTLLEIDLVSGGVDLIDTPDEDYVDPNYASLPWHARVKYTVVQYLKNW